MAKEPIGVYLGDLHSGSKLAPLTPFTGDDDIPFAPSLLQAKLAEFLGECLAEVKIIAKGHRLALFLGGDLVDGHHHKSTQIEGTQADQRALAVQLLLPWVNLADDGYGLKGTDVHVGDNGDQDRSVCKELGVPAQHFWRLEHGGKLLDWAHHATGSRKPWLRENGPIALAQKTYYECLELGERPPDLIVRHHMHHHVKAEAKGIVVASIPGWQVQTSYVRAKDPNGTLAVGVGVSWPRRGEFKFVTRRLPYEPIRVVGEKKSAPG
jgi:hypothetical protein